MSLSTLLVDARPVDHPTARQRGIGRWVTGLLTGLRDIDAPVIALYGTDAEADVLADAVPGLTARRWSPQTIGDHAVDGTWYLATQLMLHPIPLDPIPRCVTAARLPVAAVMYDVIPYRHPDLYLAEPNARRQAALRAPLARTVDAMLSISDFAAVTAAAELDYPRERIRTIGAGVDDMFRPPVDDPRQRTARVLPATIGPYVVTVAGRDDHKNVEGLLRGVGARRALPRRVAAPSGDRRRPRRRPPAALATLGRRGRCRRPRRVHRAPRRRRTGRRAPGCIARRHPVAR